MEGETSGSAGRHAALDAVAARLRCPVCGGGLARDSGSLRCTEGHTFDVARHGHVALVPPRGRVAPGDTPEMVAARVAFQAGAHHAPIAEAVAAAAAEAVGADRPVLVADAGAGTGYHLAAVLDALGPDAHGVALDTSRAALRRAAAAHPRIAAVVCDVWREIPLADGAADVLLDVFAPRNGPEMARVLRPGGALVVVTPEPGHLRELVRPLGLVGMDPVKGARLEAELAGFFAPVARRRLEYPMSLDHAAAEALVAMGPSAHHVGPEEIRRRVATLGETVRSTVAVTVATFRASERQGPPTTHPTPPTASPSGG